MRNLIICLIIVGLFGCATCPTEDIVLQGSLFCNGEFRDIFTEIKAGELNDPNNYMNMEEWEKAKEEIIFDKPETIFKQNMPTHDELDMKYPIENLKELVDILNEDKIKKK